MLSLHVLDNMNFFQMSKINSAAEKGGVSLVSDFYSGLERIGNKHLVKLWL